MPLLAHKKAMRELRGALLEHARKQHMRIRDRDDYERSFRGSRMSGMLRH